MNGYLLSPRPTAGQQLMLSGEYVFPGHPWTSLMGKGSWHTAQKDLPFIGQPPSVRMVVPHWTRSHLGRRPCQPQLCISWYWRAAHNGHWVNPSLSIFMYNIQNCLSRIALVPEGILPISLLRRSLCFHLIRVSLPIPKPGKPRVDDGLVWRKVKVPPVSSLRSWKNFWLKMKATPLISSTLASAVLFLFMKLAVIAIANFPRNSFLRNPAWGEEKKGVFLLDLVWKLKKMTEEAILGCLMGLWNQNFASLENRSSGNAKVCTQGRNTSPEA